MTSTPRTQKLRKNLKASNLKRKEVICTDAEWVKLRPFLAAWLAAIRDTA